MPEQLNIFGYFEKIEPEIITESIVEIEQEQQEEQSIEERKYILAHQQALFKDEEIISWAIEWQNMPKFSNENLAPKFQIIINFACTADVIEFGQLIDDPNLRPNQSKQLQSRWFPGQVNGNMTNQRYIQK